MCGSNVLGLTLDQGLLCQASSLKQLTDLLRCSVYFSQRQQRQEEAGRAPIPDLLVASGSG